MPKPTDATAFSYIRFSTKEQAKGDSLRRQAALRDDWCERNGVTLDRSLTLADKGVSGYSGKHRENEDRHALALFLKLVERGRIPRGSYLIVENLDRLTREDIQPALMLFLGLLQAGVRIVQLAPVEIVFDDKSDSMRIMMAIMELSRGNSESRMKSERIGGKWSEKKRQAATDGTPTTANVPGWLRVVGGKIVPVPERVRVVKRMFRLAGEGRGLLAIARALNADGVKPWGRSKAWNPSTVQHILRGKAVLGVYQPRDHRKPGRKADGPPLTNVYPPVITDSEWGAAAAALDGRQRSRGRRSPRVYNPFAGLLVNALDGNKLLVKTKRPADAPLLVNRAALNGTPGSKYVSFPARVLIDAILCVLREVTPADVLSPAGDGRADRVAELAGRRAAVEARADELRRELESGDGEVRGAVAALRTLEAQFDRLTQELAAARRDTADATADAWADCRTLLDALAKAGDRALAEDRLRVALRRVLEVIYVLVIPIGADRRAAAQVKFKTGFARLVVVHAPRFHATRPAAVGAIDSTSYPLLKRLDMARADHVRQVEKVLRRNVLTSPRPIAR